MTLRLVIGNKNYSSWSLRPWIAMKVAGIPFDETVIPLYVDGSPEQIRQHSPAGKVPILHDGDVSVWESLAIIEYVAEKFPSAGLWPSDLAARAHARAISTEMHAGFVPLRSECGMNMWRPHIKKALSADALTNVARIEAIWSGARARYGAGGPFLFGAFSAADAMYAPVVSRFETYAVDVKPETKAYMDAVRALPAWKEWRAAAMKETWELAKFEDYPRAQRLTA
jgi:glutathione S-transferase